MTEDLAPSLANTHYSTLIIESLFDYYIMDLRIGNLIFELLFAFLSVFLGLLSVFLQPSGAVHARKSFAIFKLTMKPIAALPSAYSTVW